MIQGPGGGIIHLRRGKCDDGACGTMIIRVMSPAANSLRRWHPNCSQAATGRYATALYERTVLRSVYRIQHLVVASRRGVVGRVCSGVRGAGVVAAFTRPLD